MSAQILPFRRLEEPFDPASALRRARIVAKCDEAAAAAQDLYMRAMWLKKARQASYLPSASLRAEPVGLRLVPEQNAPASLLQRLFGGGL